MRKYTRSSSLFRSPSLASSSLSASFSLLASRNTSTLSSGSLMKSSNPSPSTRITFSVDDSAQLKIRHCASAALKSYDEVPTITLPEIFELGGFTKLLEMSRGVHKRYGDLVKADLMGTNTLFVFHPEDMATVMQNEGKWPIGGAVTVWPLVRAFSARRVTSVAFAQGEEWKRLRTAVQKNIFPPIEAEAYMPLVTPVVQEALNVIKDHQASLDTFLPRVTLEMIAAVLFGKSLGTLSGTAPKEDIEYIQQVMELFQKTDALMYRNPAEVSPDEFKPLEQAFDYLMERGEYHLNTVMDKQAAGKLNTVVPPYIIKSAQQKDVTKSEVAQNVVGLLIAGVDTTANSLQWFLYHVAKHPEVQERLHAEVKAALKGRSLTKEDLNELPLLKAAFKETFRMTPTAPGTSRILQDGIALRGYQMPPGILYLLNPYPWCMDANIFENPETFNPDRYDRKLKGERSKTNPYHDSPYLNMPFSRGPRMCLGARLAELEVLSFMAGFLQDYKIALTPTSPVPEAISFLTVRPVPSPTYEITKRG